MCGKKPHYTFRDNETGTYVGVCYSKECNAQAKAATYRRNETNLFYKIASGWETNPIWHCELVFDEAVSEVVHLHTTPAAGAPPSIFSGKVSGLHFRANGGLWPIEAREGVIIKSVWTNDEQTVTELSVEEAVTHFTPLLTTIDCTNETESQGDLLHLATP